MRRTRQTIALYFLALIVLAGCATESKPIRFYVLSSLDAPSASDTKPKKGTPTIGVGPVSLPDYLKRPEIVTRPSANKLEVAALDHWSGKLDNNVASVLADNLVILLSTDKITSYPWRRNDRIDYQVRVLLTRFEQGPDGTVELHARWGIFGGRRTEKLLIAERVRIRTDVGAPGYEATAQAMSKALSDLSRVIADAFGTVLGKARSG